ncbi:hypothetical protein Phi18:2_gp17 [Cellulophaga phage phi18:2]|uniref:Uncharacterized protein n=2 Tax=Cellulophaga phage phi18:1 TaxID=1327982 RepID=S0A2Y1_9CAUD|nr:hypothetical protein Phi18:1_gp17 [Cellulophaga phage phi18:1]AGO48464.1 hypothetical protein Phi18:1_gp17 [Cellulophaga phage phi18:1]AGO49180.1 hypothetical protein Phi18:2_gp17 [Cellulophaga phage phi18:2]
MYKLYIFDSDSINHSIVILKKGFIIVEQYISKDMIIDKLSEVINILINRVEEYEH